jgi:hypothetical protein
MAQELAREILAPIVLHFLQIILVLVRAHRDNSEVAVKYQSVLYQHYIAHEHYQAMSLTNPYFRSTVLPRQEYCALISEIFQRALKNAQCLHGEDMNPKIKDQKIPLEKITPSVDYATMGKWLGLMEPVRYRSKQDQNISK